MSRYLAVLSVSAVLAGQLAGCGDDDGARSSSTPAPKSDAPAAKGTGYTVQPPEGFEDVKSRFEGSAIEIDLAYADKDSSGFATNVSVIREQPGGEFDLGDAMDAFTKQAEAQATEEGISEVEDLELDGVPAKTYAFRSRNEENGPVRQRQVITVKDDAVYTITWSAAAEEFDAQEATLDGMLASWRWS